MKYTFAALAFHPRFTLRMLLIVSFAAVALTCFSMTQIVRAQDSNATLDANAGPAGAAAITATVGPDQVNEVAKQLWCPLCSGVRLDACELKACSQMKDVIGQKLAEGTDVQAIKNYFVAQYGPQVLGEPPMEGFNWLAWLLPVVAVVAGGLFVISRARKMVRTAPAIPTTQDTATPSQPAAGDDYAHKLDEELKHYD
jgi:cytochrome c-type biogenesis protein CcmH